MVNKKNWLGILVMVLVFGMMVVGCDNIGGSPTSVVKRYYSAIVKGDAKTIGEVMTAKGAQKLTPIMSIAKDHVTALGKITEIKEDIDGDTGVVRVTFSNGDTEEIDVRKVNGKWKVSVWDEF